MPKEIIIPDDYIGTISQENDIINQINEALLDIEKKIYSIPDEQMVFEKHITDFENYVIDAYFSNNKKHANITIDDNFIVIKINDNEIRVDQDGNIV
jgi:hypothetical protein